MDLFQRIKTDRRIALILGAILVFTIFSGTFKNGFVGLDDPYVVIENHAVASFDLKEIFFTAKNVDYIPIVYLSYCFERLIAGINPSIYHFDNVLLHVANYILVFLIFFEISTNLGLAFFTALLFGIHPQHVESVAWVTERKDLLYGLFYLFSIFLYLRVRFKYQKIFRSWQFWVCLISFILSLGSKSMAVTLPAILLVFDYLAENKFLKKDLISKIPFVLVAVPWAVATFFIQSSLRQGVPTSFSFFDAIPRILDSTTFYLIKSVLPFGLCVWYDRADVIFGIAEYSIAFGIVCLLLYVANRSNAYRNHLYFGLTFFFISALPILQIIPFGKTFLFADRYSYIPTLGLFYDYSICFMILAKKLQQYFPKIQFAIYSTLALLIGLLSVSTFQQTKTWFDTKSLWENVLKHYPNSAEGHFNLGVAYEAREDLPRVIEEYKKAIEINPRLVEAQMDLGGIYIRTRQWDLAERQYKITEELEPGSPLVHMNLGLVTYLTKRYDEAEKHLLKSLSIEPDFKTTHIILGSVYLKRGEKERGKAELQKAEKIPDGAVIFNGIGHRPENPVY